MVIVWTWSVNKGLFSFEDFHGYVFFSRLLHRWSTFWKSNFKQQLGCRFDIMDNESYFFCVFWHMQLYMSWHIRSFFGFTFLNILYFFKYSCTNIFHRRSLYTFYSIVTKCFSLTKRRCDLILLHLLRDDIIIIIIVTLWSTPQFIHSFVNRMIDIFAMAYFKTWE